MPTVPKSTLQTFINMQCDLRNSVSVDGIILTETVREQTIYDSIGPTYYGLYFSKPDYWLPVDKTICVKNIPRITLAYDVMKRIRHILQSLKELSFGCFPDRDSQGSCFRLFIVCTSQAEAAVVVKMLECDPKGLPPAEIRPRGEILGHQVLKEHMPILRLLANVPVNVGFLGHHVVLRIGSDDSSKYRKEFIWLLNTDIHYNQNYPDRPNEVTLCLDPTSRRCEPFTMGTPNEKDSWETDNVAGLISSGIQKKLYQYNNTLEITFAFHTFSKTEYLKSALKSTIDLQNFQIITGPNKTSCGGQIGDHHSQGSRSHKERRKQDGHALGTQNLVDRGGQRHPGLTENCDPQHPNRSITSNTERSKQWEINDHDTGRINEKRNPSTSSYDSWRRKESLENQPAWKEGNHCFGYRFLGNNQQYKNRGGEDGARGNYRSEVSKPTSKNRELEGLHNDSYNREFYQRAQERYLDRKVGGCPRVRTSDARSLKRNREKAKEKGDYPDPTGPAIKRRKQDPDTPSSSHNGYIDRTREIHHRSYLDVHNHQQSQTISKRLSFTQPTSTPQTPQEARELSSQKAPCYQHNKS